MKILLIAGIFIVFSCKAQNLPLNTALSNIPNNVYVKDTNNELTPYIGNYKANYGGKEITLFITKQENKLIDYGDQKFYRDALIVKYIVKNSSGTILQDTKNNNTDIDFYSTKIKSTQSSITFANPN
ncbi:hypothetical protein [Chryseobacterium sp. ISL-6]|uniref:DUF6705 family protein n=1 Tax=Chryseobacterium sp. ISL-6 TaxID=2819143 RepID=UPI001BE94FAD|nr:hypothetical protein [Chryseobacterium sp. ISL-6]MBT2620742.1 hypothetical protein [Chryseobacterium sp. ISL-6]